MSFIGIFWQQISAGRIVVVRNPGDPIFHETGYNLVIFGLQVH
jgi:hypothetical protein